MRKERKREGTRPKKLGQVYLDDDNMDHEDYKRRKKKLADRLADRVVPGIDAMKGAGRLQGDLLELWEKASLGERRNIFMTMLEADYVDARDEKGIVGIKAKPAFKPIFQLADTIEGSGITLLKEATNGKASAASLDATEFISCLWWRQARGLNSA